MSIISTTRTNHRAPRNRPLEEFYQEKKRRHTSLGDIRIGGIRLTVKGLLLYLLIATVVGISTFGVDYYLTNRQVKDVAISVISEHDNHFLLEEDVMSLLKGNAEAGLIGKRMGDIHLDNLEARLYAHPSVKKAEVYKSLGGSIYAEVEMRRPIARIINNNGSKVYIDEQGIKFPASIRHSAHVPLIRGNFDELAVPSDSFECVTIEAAIPVYQYIHSHPFWDAQISEIDIKQDGQLVLYPQIGDTYIEFGQPVNIEEKFENLRLFYEQVLGEMGWRKYRGVSVKFRGQVVGKKR